MSHKPTYEELESRNITDRRKAEEALRKSEKRYRLITENVADVIWTMDMGFRFTYISPSILQQRGYTVEESMNQSLDELILPESLANIMKLVEQRLNSIEAGDDEGCPEVRSREIH